MARHESGEGILISGALLQRAYGPRGFDLAKIPGEEWNREVPGTRDNPPVHVRRVRLRVLADPIAELAEAKARGRRPMRK